MCASRSHPLNSLILFCCHQWLLVLRKLLHRNPLICSPTIFLVNLQAQSLRTHRQPRAVQTAAARRSRDPRRCSDARVENSSRVCKLRETARRELTDIGARAALLTTHRSKGFVVQRSKHHACTRPLHPSLTSAERSWQSLAGQQQLNPQSSTPAWLPVVSGYLAERERVQKEQAREKDGEKLPRRHHRGKKKRACASDTVVRSHPKNPDGAGAGAGARGAP
jgi:hypothetical protein